jgi:alpha-galactosidase
MDMKAVIIGAGSAFGGRLSVDILSRAPLQDSTIALCDIDPEKLDLTSRYVQKVIDTHKLPAKLETGIDRRDVLPGADVVVLSVSIGGPAYYDEPYESEINIPQRYGVTQAVGDTVGPGGLFRALRTAPVMLQMIDDINRLAPGALILNYTNPMAILTWLFNERSQSPVLGLCHGVTGNSWRMASLIDVSRDDCEFLAAGINHMTWFLEFTHKGEDVLPRIHQRIIEEGKKARLENPGSTPQNFAYRGEMIEALGYFTTESDRHFPEYVPWFQHEDRWDFMKYYNITKGVKGRRQQWYEDMGVKASQAESVELVRSHESMSGIMEARCTNEPYTFSGNVMNEGHITNLPEGCCVELPVTVDSGSIEPLHVGDLPPACAALCRSNVDFQELVVDAIREQSRDLARQALLFDPATQAVLSVRRTAQLFDEMWDAEKDLLGYYS